MNTYIAEFIKAPGLLERLLTEVPWQRATEARSECFMSDLPVSYTYGKGRGVRTYTSIPYCAGVGYILKLVNDELRDRSSWGPMNVCFLNYYVNEREHLGWHADDHEYTDHTRPICVVSVGAAREIWTRTLPIPDAPEAYRRSFGLTHRQLLESGSLYTMPPGFQQTHQHRIPKGDRPMGPRVSMTFRALLPSAYQGGYG